jgi:hypothetical protein
MSTIGPQFGTVGPLKIFLGSVGGFAHRCAGGHSGRSPSTGARPRRWRLATGVDVSKPGDLATFVVRLAGARKACKGTARTRIAPIIAAVVDRVR